MESQRSVADWRYSVFGRAKSPEHVVGRMVMEVGELMAVIGYPICGLEIEHHGREISHEECYPVEYTPEQLEAIRDEMADVLVVLYGAADEFGIDLRAALDAKMATNRARKWDVSAPGLGRHS